MKSQLIRKILLFLAVIAFSSAAMCKDLLKKPSPFRLVVDLAGVLTPAENEMLNNKLRYYDDSSSVQICIVIDQSLDGEDIFDYSHRLARDWGIGQKGKNNGLLIYLSIKDRLSRIQVGYGLEGAIPDAAAKGIIEDYMLPQFRAGNYYAGLDTATNILIGLARKDFPPDKYMTKKAKKPVSVLYPILIILGLTLLFSMIFKNKNGGNRGTGWGPFMMGAGTFGGFGGGGGFGSGGGGGGFSGGGFGGGGFGGGGAGGGW